MAASAHRALRIILALISVLTAMGGVLLVFGSKALIVRMSLGPPESEFTTLLLVIVKELGGILLMFSYLLYRAFRDPVRNVAIVDTLIVGLCVLALTPLLSFYTLDFGRWYPWYFFPWGRSLLRLAFAGLLFYLRPREAGATPS